MEITHSLRERFVKDYKIPIKIFREPYFGYQLALFDTYYDCVDKYSIFINSVNKYPNEEEYYCFYNTTKDIIMNYVKTNSAFLEFNNCDMSEWNKVLATISKYQFLSKDIYKKSFVGRRFLSIDMIKANFNVLKHYNPKIFNNVETYEDFIHMFTKDENIVNSKHIREVIFGQCNCGRHITYERYLMAKLVLSVLNDEIQDTKVTRSVVFFSNDEVIFDITDMSKEQIKKISDAFKNLTVVPLRFEQFTLKCIYKDNIDDISYIKEFDDGKIAIKKYQSFYLPIIIKYLRNEPVIEEDLIFEHNDILCKILEVPNIHIE